VTVTAPGVERIIIRKCDGISEFKACVALQKEVWNFDDADLVPLRIFVVSQKIGGQIIGAFDGNELVGFAFSIPGERGGRAYLHSHMLAVRATWRDHGLGRRLKLAQREDGIRRGFELIEWTFDPLEIRNAHFNFRLGAIVRRFIPNMYGLTTSPLHGGLPTDRLVAEWHLRSARVRRALSDKRHRKSRGKEYARIRVPADFARIRGTKPEEAARLQAEVRQEFEHWLVSGYAGTGINITDDAAEYLLEPWTDK
jgi:predicted GNAT superfamily acetyltransferase